MSREGRPRLLLIHLHPSPFVLDDLALLSESYEVRVFHFDTGRPTPGFGRVLGLCFAFLRELLWLLREWPKASLVYGWFADHHLALPLVFCGLMRRPIAVVLGGFEANLLPELRYGVLHSRWRAPLARSVLRHASLLLPVAESLIECEERHSRWPDRRRNGIRVHVPGLPTPVRVVPTGYDAEAWPPGASEREPVVVSVAGISDHRTLKVKGIDLLIEAARLLPEVSFLIIGLSDRMRREAARDYQPPGNVEFQAPVPRTDLARVYARSSVYAQLSRTEGLPNVVCEAMLCGCIPVVSPVGGMPAAVGSTGFVVESPQPADIAGSLKRALDAVSDPVSAAVARALARNRIVLGFSLERRRTELTVLLRSLQAPSAA